MLQRILMPTDGSAESEKPAALVSRLARAQSAEVTLLRVVENPTYLAGSEEFLVPANVYEEVSTGLERDARNTLGRLQARLEADGVTSSAVVLRGHPAAALLDYIKDERPDLVVMATHGRTGLQRFALGSVTDRVLREATAPALVTRMSGGETASLESALVMLDGSGLAEQVLPLVEALAGHPLKQIKLYRVVPDPSDRGAATNYLDGVAARLAPTGVRTEVAVDIGDPKANVTRVARDFDLVILCTHGRSGFDRLRHGSVADHVIQQVDRPVLVVRAPGA